MAYEILLHPQVRRELDKIPDPPFKRIDSVIRSLGENPRRFGVKKLEGNLHRVRVGDWRVIYAIVDEGRKVIILRVVRRSEKTYRGL